MKNKQSDIMKLQSNMILENIDLTKLYLPTEHKVNKRKLHKLLTTLHYKTNDYIALSLDIPVVEVNKIVKSLYEQYTIKNLPSGWSMLLGTEDYAVHKHRYVVNIHTRRLLRAVRVLKGYPNTEK